ncbi:acyl-CoA carboxylase epsilon subunit [Arthrobacter sp. SIMBA_036]|uniref:acyl-CoA carboxylase epsilon subunit n=1 Tax=Arthrobacter sp. SIMBA_036 TaxID=3085778 RepID=UPI00397A5B0C
MSADQAPRQGSEQAADTVAVEPLFTVVKGEPSAEELAALAAVVLSLGGEPEAAAAPPTQRHWVRRQQLRLDPTPGPGAWKRSRG